MGAGCSSSRSTNARGPIRRGSDLSSRSSSASSRSSLNSPAPVENDHVNGHVVHKKTDSLSKFPSAGQLIVEKAKEFWKEIQNLKVPSTDGLTTEGLVDEIIDHERKYNGVDLDKALESDEARGDEVKKVRHTLRQIRKAMTNDEVATAKSMGLLDEKGKIPKYDLLAANNDRSLAPMPPDAVPFSIWGWKLSEAAKFKNATKELVKHNICNLIRNFQVMKDDDTRMMIKMFMEAGIWGLGLHGLQAVWNILGTLPELTPETEAFAILEGVKAVGENVIKFAIRASIVAVLAPLFTQDKGNAAAVMVIMNDSDEDMQMSHFSITYGKVVGTFKEQLSSDNPQPIIPKRMPAIVNSKTGKTIVQGSIQACLFAARKRNQALTGSQGALEFEPTQIFPMGLFVGWEVPFAYRNNRIVVSADYDESAVDFSILVDKSENDDSQESHSNSSMGGKITGRVNSAHGHQAYCIVNITAPAKPLIEAAKEPSPEEKAADVSEKLKSVEFPDVTSGKTADQLMEDILNHEKEHHGIDWRAAVQQGDRALRNAVHKAHNRLHKIRKQMNSHEVKRAKEMGLLHSNGDVKTLDLLGDEAVANPNLAPIPEGATAFPCWGWSLEEAAKFQNATGDEIKQLILNLIRNFQVMDNSDERYLVHLFMKLGLFGFGAMAVHAVWKCLKIFDTATSIAEVIVEVGIRTIQFAIAVFVLAILVPIFIYAMKDAAGVMVVINDTFEDMNLEALTATHGKITGVFKEKNDKSPPLPIIPKREKPAYNDKGIKMNNGAVYGGFFVFRKRDSALIGTQGAFKFGVTADYPDGVFVGWEVPLSQGKNRLLVSADFKGGVEAWSDKTNDDGKQEDTSTSSKKATITGRVNDGSGSQAYFIVNIGAASGSLLSSAVPEEDIEEKAEKFWNEIKDLKTPNDTDGKTSDQVIADIIKHEKTHHGIDWEAAAKGGEKEMAAVMKKSHERFQEIRKKMSAKEVERAKSMGLLDSNGEVPSFDVFGDGNVGTAPIPGGAVPYTVWGWKEERAAQYQAASGERIKDLITNLIRNFQVMGQDDERMMTKMFMESGLWALGSYGLVKVVQILRTLYKLTQATEAFAVVTGIMEVGINVIKLGITVVIVAILVPLFIFMTKDACAVFVIVNDTDDDLDLVDYHATHGKIVGIFKENPDVDNPKPIIPKRLPPIINPKTGKEICKGSIQAGFFAARKHDNALVGSQGALKFGPMTSFAQGVFMGWEVPLSGSSNRLLVSTDFNGNTSQFSDKTNDDGKQEDAANGSNGAKVVGRVHSGSGSQGYYVFNVTEPKKSSSENPVLLALPPEKDSKKKSDEELLNEIFDHEKDVHGIDWRAAAKGGKEAIKEATKKARDHMQSIADKMTKAERHHAMTMGLVDSNGKVPEFDLLAEHDEPAVLEASMTATPTVPIPSSATPYMVWGWKPSKAKEFEDSTGGDIKSKVLNLIHEFQAMKSDTKEQMANAFMQAGIWSVGMVGLKAVWNALRAASAISEAVEIEAIAEGIAAIGVSVVTLAIAVCILAVLVPIFIFMSKNAAAIMVLINDTDEDIRMIDLHATHGKIIGIFKEKAELDNPQPILPKRLPPIINPTTKKVMVEGSVQAGFFAARKRDNALVGSQGGMRFDATERYPQGIYIGWEVPLSFTSNRLLVSARFTGSASEFSNETNDHGEQEDSSQSTKGAVVSGRVNSSSGSEAYYIFSIK